MIYTANGKFIHFTSLKTQRNIFVVKTPGEAEFVEMIEHWVVLEEWDKGSYFPPRSL